MLVGDDDDDIAYGGEWGMVPGTRDLGLGSYRGQRNNRMLLSRGIAAL